LDKDETNHLRVVRKNPGDTVEAITGDGFYYRCSIEKINKKDAVLLITEKSEKEKEIFPKINIFVGNSKWERLRWITEKAVELRANSINIVNSEKSKFDFENTEKLKKVSVEALKQTKYSVIPDINVIDSYYQIKNTEKNFVFDFCTVKLTKKDFSENIMNFNLIFGPESGFSDKEKKYFSENNFITRSLGNTIMRFETAVIYVLSGINFYLERI